MAQLSWKTLWKFLKILRIELPHDPTIPLLVIYPKELQKKKKKEFLSALPYSLQHYS